MPKRWVVCGIWTLLISAGLLTFGRYAGAEQPTKPGKVLISDIIIDCNQRPNTEKIKVRKVTFLGAKHIKQDELQRITGVRPGMPLNPNLNHRSCQKILAKYEDLGLPFADCQLIKGGDSDDTEVVYQITEGEKIKVRDIRFTGNSFVSGARLSQKIPLCVGYTFHREDAEAGIKELYTFYRDAGYRDVRVALEIKRGKVPDEITMIYHIHEGPRYRNDGDSQE